MMKKNNKNLVLSLAALVLLSVGCSNKSTRKPSNEKEQIEEIQNSKKEELIRQRDEAEKERNQKCREDRSKSKHYIIFVHGYKGHINTFGSMPEVFSQQLDQLKTTECVITIRLVYSTGDNTKSVFDFAKEINEQLISKITKERLIFSGNGDIKNKISFVAHSQGGLLTAIALQRAIKDSKNVALSPYIPLIKNFITLGTPFWGSWIAELADRDTGKFVLKTIDFVNNEKPMGKQELADMSYGSENIFNLHNWWREFKTELNSLKENKGSFRDKSTEEFRLLNIAGLFPELEPVSLEIHSVLSRKLIEKNLDPKLFFILGPGKVYLNLTALSFIQNSKKLLESINTDPKKKRAFREKFHSIFFPGALRWEGDTLVNATSARWNFIYYNSNATNPNQNLNTANVLVKNDYEMIQALHASPWASQYYDEVEAPEICYNTTEGLKYCDHPGLMWTLKQLANCENTVCNPQALDNIQQSPKNFQVLSSESDYLKSQMRYFQLQVNIQLPENYIVNAELLKARVNNGEIIETMYENVNDKDILFHDLRLASKDLKKTAFSGLSLLNKSILPILIYDKLFKTEDTTVQNINQYRVGLNAEVIQSNPEIKLELARLTEAFSYDVKFLPSKDKSIINEAKGQRLLVTIRGRIMAKSNPYIDPLPPHVLKDGVTIPMQVRMPCDINKVCPKLSKLMKINLKPTWLTWVDMDLTRVQEKK